MKPYEYLPRPFLRGEVERSEGEGFRQHVGKTPHPHPLPLKRGEGVKILGIVVVSLLLAACSKAPAPVAQTPDPAPDNAVTRYTENLMRNQKRAQQVADKANSVIAKEQTMMNQAASQSEDQPR